MGGAVALNASVWKTKTLVQALDTILFPDVAPTYTVPTIAASANTSGTLEIGQTISQLITATATKNDGGDVLTIYTQRNNANIHTNVAFTNANTTNIAAQFGYADPNNPNKIYTSLYVDSGFVVVSGATTWRSMSDYAAGLAKKNNKGVDDVRAFAVRSASAPQSASNGFTSSTSTVTGIYPYFWGVSGTSLTASDIATLIAAGSTTKVLASSVGTVTVTFAAASQYVWVAIPTVSTIKTTWYNTGLNNGSIGAGQFILAPVSQNVNSPNSYWSAVSYRIYVSGYSTTTSGAIEFRN